MRPIDFILIVGIIIAGGMSLANNPAKPKPTPDCQCVDCTCDPCECGPVVVTPDEPDHIPDPGKKVDGSRYFMFFTQQACPSCPAMHALAKQLESEGHYLLVVDVEKNPEFSARHGVTSTPQFLIYDRDTRQYIRRVIGTTTRDQLLNDEAPQRTIPAATNQQRIIRQDAYRQPAMRQTGWVRGGRVFSACGPGGCG